jgi:hypothetical protein
MYQTLLASDMVGASSGMLASGRKAIKSKFIRALMAGNSLPLPTAIYTALECSYGVFTQCSNLDAIFCWRFKRGRASVPRRLLEEGRINDLLLTFLVS